MGGYNLADLVGVALIIGLLAPPAYMGAMQCRKAAGRRGRGAAARKGTCAPAGSGSADDAVLDDGSYDERVNERSRGHRTGRRKSMAERLMAGDVDSEVGTTLSHGCQSLGGTERYALGGELGAIGGRVGGEIGRPLKLREVAGRPGARRKHGRRGAAAGEGASLVDGDAEHG